MILKDWEATNYKSIVGSQFAEFRGINVLAGKNNTGKSGVIDALADYQEAFPVANSDKIDQAWFDSRLSRKEDTRRISLQLTFELEESEWERFYQGLVDANRVSETAKRRWNEDDFIEIRHELLLKRDISGEIRGESNVYSDFDGEEVAIREGSLVEGEAEYLSFNKLDKIETTDTRTRGWAKLLDVMSDSIDSWQFVDAFRRPDDLSDAIESQTLEKSGENLSQVLLTLVAENDEKFDRIEEEYARVMEGVEKMKSPLQGNQTTVKIVEDAFSESFDLSEISAGSKEILTLITRILLASDDSDLVLIEEPELHLHPGAQRKVFNLISSELGGQDGPQVILSTHSSVFINGDDVDCVINVSRENETRLAQSSQGAINDSLQELGYRYGGMLQSDAVVIVEGTTDRIVFRTLADKYGFPLEENRVGICVMDNSSELIKHSKAIVKLLSVFSIPYLFVCDSDLTEHIDGVSSDADLTPQEQEAAICGHVNPNGDRTESWEEMSKENIHAWREEELEAYLLADREAVLRKFDIEEQELDKVLGDSSLDPDQKLDKIGEISRPYIEEGQDEIKKGTDLSDLSAEVELANLPKEFHDVMEDIAGLVNRREVIKKKRPDKP